MKVKAYKAGKSLRVTVPKAYFEMFSKFSEQAGAGLVPRLFLLASYVDSRSNIDEPYFSNCDFGLALYVGKDKAYNSDVRRFGKTICANKADDDYVFTETFSAFRVANMRQMYNRAVKCAGLNEKIPGHKFGKYHMKIYKKRWFTQAVSSDIPEYVAQAMLGRKKYLDQYMALPLNQKREFAKKILRKVSIYASEADEAIKRRIAAETLGLPSLTTEQFTKLRGVLLRSLDMPQSPILSEV